MYRDSEPFFRAVPGFAEPAALREMNGVTMAFIGDAVYELLVRDHVLSVLNGKVQLLHKKTVSFSNAAFQSAAAKALLPTLTQEEQAVFRRGRNAHTAHTPKNKTRADYHLATALEAVFGYLYLTKQEQRISCLFQAIVKMNEEYENAKNQ